MRTLIENATIVNEGTRFVGSVLVENEHIRHILKENQSPLEPIDRRVDARGCYLLPGAIDAHVHFRDPGLTRKGDMQTESQAAVAGGVTSVMDMPNCIPQTTTREVWEQKVERAQAVCATNYSFYLGATHDNLQEIATADPTRICGIKIFMGSSTGNMLVTDHDVLENVFRESPLPIALHCEDPEVIAQNTRIYCQIYGEDPDVRFHPQIRSTEACYRSSAQAVELAHRTGAHIHLLHISTARELDLLEQESAADKQITAEACVGHLFFSEEDYPTLGTRIKCNPAIKSRTDRDALRQAIVTNRLDTIGTDHAPHLLSEKTGGCIKAASGMPMIQFSLISLLELADKGVFTLEQLVEKMCHAPARIFRLNERGFIKEGYKADLTLVRPNQPWTLTPDRILSRCKWSPLEGHTFRWKVERTYVNGQCAYKNGQVDSSVRGQLLAFCPNRLGR